MQTGLTSQSPKRRSAEAADLSQSISEEECLTLFLSFHERRWGPGAKVPAEDDGEAEGRGRRRPGVSQERIINKTNGSLL